MEYLWIVFVIIYAFLKSSRDCMKKASLKRSSLYEVLFFYTFLGFLLTLPNISEALSLSPKFIFFIFIKSSFVCLAWFFSCLALDKMSVSLYGIMDLSSVIFSMLLAIFALGESLTLPKAIGAVLVMTGLLLVNLGKTSKIEKTPFRVILFALLYCFFNSFSGTMDKVLMKYMTSSQLQFWFMFFMSLIYGIVLVLRKEKMQIKALAKNFWVPLMSISLVLGDKFLFEANGSPFSEVTVMTVIKQSAVIMTVLLGWIIYKEKNIPYKLFCCGIILGGICISVFA